MGRQSETVCMWAALIATLLASWTPPPMSEAVLRVETSPAGVVVLLDGHLHCRSTPCARFVPPGSYLLTALHEDAATTTQRVTVALPETTVRVELPPR